MSKTPPLLTKDEMQEASARLRAYLRDEMEVEVGQLPATEPESGVPEIVLELAADGQDLSTVRLLPDDGCYWYEHRGQVETTLLPLRARNGAAICRQAQA